MTSLPLCSIAPATLRVHRFLLLLASVAVAAAIAAADPGVARLVGTCTALPAYMLWIHSDLRARQVRGGSLVGQLLVALLPGVGLLAYFLASRGRVGLLLWTASVGAMTVAAAMAGLFGHVVVLAATGRA